MSTQNSKAVNPIILRYYQNYNNHCKTLGAMYLSLLLRAVNATVVATGWQSRKKILIGDGT
jgi:hypothetical protein